MVVIKIQDNTKSRQEKIDVLEKIVSK